MKKQGPDVYFWVVNARILTPKSGIYSIFIMTLQFLGISGHFFWYDGTGPDAFFWVGNTRIPIPKGWVVPYPPVDLYSDLPKSGIYSISIMTLRFFGVFWGVSGHLVFSV